MRNGPFACLVKLWREQRGEAPELGVVVVVSITGSTVFCRQEAGDLLRRCKEGEQEEEEEEVL